MRSVGKSLSSFRVFLPAIIAICLWSTVGVVTEHGLRYGHMGDIILFEYIFSVIGFSAIVFMRHRKEFNMVLKKACWRSLGQCAIIGFFNISHNLLYTLSLEQGDAFISNSMNYLWPVILFLLINLSDSRNFYNAKWVLLTTFLGFFGAVLLFSDSVEYNNDIGGGTILAVLSAICASCYMFLARNQQKSQKMSTEVIFLIGYIASMPVISIFFMSSRLSTFGDIDSIIVGIYLGACVAVFAERSWAYAIRSNRSGSVVTLGFLIPLFSILFMSVFYPPQWSLLNIFGSLIILVACSLVVFLEGVAVHNRDRRVEKLFQRLLNR